MALDPALVGPLGSVVGGAATLRGTVISNNQQARRDLAKRRQERKLEAYNNILRSLLRAIHRRSVFDADIGPQLAKNIVADWLDDLINAEYWLAVHAGAARRALPASPANGCTPCWSGGAATPKAQHRWSHRGQQISRQDSRIRLWTALPAMGQ